MDENKFCCAREGFDSFVVFELKNIDDFGPKENAFGCLGFSWRKVSTGLVGIGSELVEVDIADAVIANGEGVTVNDVENRGDIVGAKDDEDAIIVGDSVAIFLC